jgi:hypothetical protein
MPDSRANAAAKLEGGGPTASHAEQKKTAEKRNEVRNEAASKDKSEKKDKSKTVEEVLNEMSPCEAGYAWVREGNGYRCKGGSHTISDADIHAKM